MGDSLIDWTARGAVGCFALRLLLLMRRRGHVADAVEIAVWSAGWLLLAAHMACAFQFQHHWSHAAAYDHTARRTFETVGWNWGGGLYFNYLTLALWGADVCTLWLADRPGRRPSRWWTGLVVGWIGFIVLNATLVFGPRWWWAVGIVFAIAACLPLSPAERSDSSNDTIQGRGPG